MFRVDGLLKTTGGRLISGKRNAAIGRISIDSRTIKKGEAFIAIKGSSFDGHNFINAAIKKGAGCIIYKSGGQEVAKSQDVVFVEVKDTVRALGDIARYQRGKFGIPIIAVTGSNGKTTAKEMVAWVLSKRFKVLKNEGTKNNHIGLPLTLLNLNRNHDAAILELGTNHSGEILNLARICLPNIGVITNVGPAHLEYFHNLEGVLREKYSLIENLRNPNLAILNSDDRLLKSRISAAPKRPFVLSFGIARKSDFTASRVRVSPGKFEFTVNQKYKFTLKTLGYHNIYNALVAIVIARTLGMEYAEAAGQLATFEFPAGRLRLEKLNKINFIDDTYNSNPLSLEQALNTLANFRVKGRRILVMGDMLELGSRRKVFHYRMGEKASEACDVFIAVGELSGLAASAARGLGFDTRNIYTCDSTQAARDILFHKISVCADDLVLVKGSRAMKMEEVFNSPINLRTSELTNQLTR